MNKIARITGLAIAATTMSASANMNGGSSDVLLEIDLTVINVISITATDGLAAADSTTSIAVGFTMDSFFAAADTFLGVASFGSLTTGNEDSDGSPALWSYANAAALNVYSFSGPTTTASTTAGEIAFAGSGAWAVTPAVYAAMLAGNSTGGVYMGTDNDDVSGATFVGTWNVIPAPSSMALLGLGGIVAGRRRR